jgi:hypothetical protein
VSLVNESTLPEEYFRVPRSARIWNYWMGGKDNYPVDREAGDAWAAVDPGIVRVAKESRQFLIRAVRFLAAEAGIRQFLDIGTGLPTMQNTHEVAQAEAPETKIVYVDNDPLVLAHARALLTNTTEAGVTTYVNADVHDPERILVEAAETLDFAEPVAVLFFDILGHVADYARARDIVRSVLAATVSGSYLGLRDGVVSEAGSAAAADYAETGAVAYHLRRVDEIKSYFDGFELVEPGVVPITQWRPPIPGAAKPIENYGGLARKP